MNFETEPTLQEFVKVFNEYKDEIMDKNGNVQSHTMPASITVYDAAGDSYIIKALNMDYLGGCGCPSGIEIFIEKD